MVGAIFDVLNNINIIICIEQKTITKRRRGQSSWRPVSHGVSDRHGSPDRVVVGSHRGAIVVGGRRGAIAVGRRQGGRAHANAVDQRGQRDQRPVDGRVQRPIAVRTPVAESRRTVCAAAAAAAEHRGRTLARQIPHRGVVDDGRYRVQLPQVRSAGGVGRRRCVRYRGRSVAPHRLGGRQLLRDGDFRRSRVIGEKVSQYDAYAVSSH